MNAWQVMMLDLEARIPLCMRTPRMHAYMAGDDARP